MDNAFHDDVHNFKEIFDFLSNKKFTNSEIAKFSEVICFTLPQIEDSFERLNLFTFNKKEIENLLIEKLEIGDDDSTRITTNDLLKFFTLSNYFSDSQQERIVAAIKGLVSSTLSKKFQTSNLIRRQNLVADIILILHENDSNLNRVLEWIYNIYILTPLNEATYYNTNIIWTLFKQTICNIFEGCDVFAKKKEIKVLHQDLSDDLSNFSLE